MIARAAVAMLLLAAFAATAAAAPSGSVSTKLVGRWSRRITAADWRRFGVGGHAFPSGTWRLVVKSSGIVHVYAPRSRATSFFTRFRTARSRLTIGVMPFCTIAADRYRWAVRSARLTVRRVSDGCAPRTALFAGTWRRR